MKIRSHAPWVWLGMSLASTITLGLCGTYLHLMRLDGRDGWFVYVFIAPFLLVGLFLGYVGLRELLRIIVRGSWWLELPAGGGVRGQPLVVTLRAARDRRTVGDVTCRLRCIRIVRYGHGRADTTTLWESTWTVSAPLIRPDAGLALLLPIPDNAEPSALDRSGSGVQWQLNVVVSTQHGHEEPVFDLPIR